MMVEPTPADWIALAGVGIVLTIGLAALFSFNLAECVGRLLLRKSSQDERPAGSLANRSNVVDPNPRAEP